MQELIELIQSGDLTNNGILQRLTTLHNTNCEEMDEAISQIEQLEAQATLNQIATLELKSKLTATEEAINAKNIAIKIIEQKGLEAVAYAQDFQNKLTVAESQLKLMNQHKADLKKLKPRIKRLASANEAHQKYRKAAIPKLRATEDRLALMHRENAKLRLTGHKKVGKYSFTIFPVKVNTEHKDRKVGLVVYNQEGAMKVLTRNSLDGGITQPKSHNFKFNIEEDTWINSFFDVADAHDNRFDDAVLQLVK